MSPGKPAKLGVFTLAMINVAAVLSLRNFPSMADYGYAVVFYLTLSSVCFFIPSALVSAELASAWPKKGGVYLWVREAFGDRWGFVAIFMQWVENLPWFPAVLTFVASSLAYAYKPELAENKLYVVVVVLVAMWAATLLNFRGMKLSAFLSSSGAISGSLVPGLAIITLAGAYLISGDKPAIDFTPGALVPDLGSLDQLMLMVGMLLAIAGMELSAVHVTEVDNPRKNFPKAIFIAAVIIIFISVVASLSIAIVIPQSSISLSAGVNQAFEDLLRMFHLDWLTPVVSLLLAYGALTMVVTWMVGPSKGVREVAGDGYLPAYMNRSNKQGMPTGTLIVQGVLSSLLTLNVLFMPTVSSAFWIMSALAIQLYLVMYLLMFAAAIKLRYSQPDVERPYRVPGGKAGMWLVAGIAFLTSLLVFFFGFIPTSSVRAEGALAMAAYVAFLVAGVLVFVSIPLVFYRRAEKRGVAGAKGTQAGGGTSADL
ncbi:MAG: amino acid permease [Gaiellales bacterium]|nr:MAG: amino acid permease [Gaiellales bacterium]